MYIKNYMICMYFVGCGKPLRNTHIYILSIYISKYAIYIYTYILKNIYVKKLDNIYFVGCGKPLRNTYIYIKYIYIYQNMQYIYIKICNIYVYFEK